MSSNLINASLSSGINPIYDFIKKRQENERFSKTIELCATIALVIALAMFAIIPTVGTISNLYTEIESKKKLKQDLISKVDQVIKAQASFAELQKRYYLLDQSLPQKRELANTTVQIVGYQQKNGIEIKGVSILGNEPITSSLVTKEKELKALSFSITKKINYDQIEPFLVAARNLRRLTYYDSVSIIVEQDKETKVNTPKISLKSQLYYLPSSDDKIKK